MEKSKKPRWIRDLLRFLPLKSQFVLSGNVRDHFPKETSQDKYTSQSMLSFLAGELFDAGFEQVLCYNPVHGFRAVDRLGNVKVDPGVQKDLGLDGSGDGTTLKEFAQGLECHVKRTTPPVALIADFASRIINRPDSLHTEEQRCFTRALVLAHEAKSRPYGPNSNPFFNSVIWIAEKEGDLPDWFLIDNPRIRQIMVPKPDHIVRRQIVSNLITNLEGYEQSSHDEIKDAEKAFVEQTEGMLIIDLMAISQLCRSEDLHLGQIGDAVRHFKLGVTEDPWKNIDKSKISDGKEVIGKRVKGQQHAVTHMLDIIKRAIIGVGGAGRGRPRGVAFLAGPTGVGKTELAKAITSVLFGDESAYIRFDMSEFSAEHSDQRLIGAPPGYVGYDVGGELTNSIREKPFSVVLFDEIEKAHPRIMDKFLQVLDDGVLTSGRGDRVYFSEAFIIFTSNLGIYRIDNDGNRIQQVSSDEPFSDISRKVRVEIEQHFKTVLGRPEILNRIGENIIVFDFIRPETAKAIFDQMVENILTDLLNIQGLRIILSPSARSTLEELCISDLSNGGRGIRNKLEVHFVNPLARAFFDDVSSSKKETVHTITAIEAGTVTTVLLDSKSEVAV